MLRSTRSASIIALLLVLSTILAGGEAAVAGVTPSLEKALATSDFPWRADDGTYTVWVFFRDKGLTGEDLEQALERAENQLSEKTAWRRAKMKRDGEPLVEVGDLDLHAPYLQQASATGAELRRESRWLNAASFQATAEQIRQLSALDFVDRVDLVAKFRRPELPPQEPEVPQDDPLKDAGTRWDIDYGGNQAAMEQFNVPAVHAMGINGQGVIIGMLDTGFHTSHESLINIPLLAAYDFVNDDENVDNESGDPSSSRNHGTQTMSTAMGNMPGAHVAPAFGASAVLAKTEDVSQEIPIEEDQWVAGMEWAETYGVDIISSSLGYTDWYTWADMDGETALTTIAADLAVERGIVVINSAGNERNASWGHIIAPADGFNVITVGAVTSSGDYSSFSSPGPSYDGRIKPDVAALGTSNHVADPNNDFGYTTASGTSFSCPLTSGVAALILSRAPSLTPLQVREALRETASMADAPNNDYGWGLIDALAAVTYFGPNFEHTPLTDTEDTTGPYTLGMMITDRLGLDESTARVWYRTDGGAWQETPITPTGGGPVSYWAQIPGQPDGTVIDYYLEAASLDGTTTRLPAQAPDEFFSFRVGQDVTAPELVHFPLRDQAYIMWPPVVSCQASDNLGMDRVELTFTHNGGPEQGPFDLIDDGSGTYSLEFPLTPAEVAIGDVISYTLTAYDAAQTPNTAVFGPAEFHVIDTLGVVLVLDDNPDAAVADHKVDFSRKDEPVLPAETGRSSGATIAGWLTNAGYVVDVLPAAIISPDQLAGYQAVVLASGNSTTPVNGNAPRVALQEWASQGGKILIEGGETGYDALSSPTYPDFAAQVLHCVDWNGDSAGPLLAAPGMGSHPLLTSPHLVPTQISLSYNGYGDQDAVTPAADAYAVMVTSSYAGDGGIVVYDDNPAPQSAQIVYFAFNLEAMDSATGAKLAENALAFLLAPEDPPSSSISGRATLAGQSDHSGILIDLGGGRTAVTGADGLWSFSDLYSGNYTLLASKDGWTTARQDIVLEGGENLTDVNLTLSPILETNYVVYPGVTIPDNDPAGVTSTITVPEGEAGVISSVTVDVYIQHTYIGDLTVRLTSPAGTSVVLHNRSGSGDDNILGNWPETRPVDGPGSLDDFIGENNAGVWTLFLTDSVGSDEGSLSMWGLNFLLPQTVSAAPDGNLPVATRLHGNVPNPFNPSTEINFDLARNAKVRLDIYDLRGRLVRRLVDEPLPAGTHAVRWDGRDGKGHGVSSGTYLYRLRAGDVVQDRKMLLVR